MKFRIGFFSVCLCLISFHKTCIIAEPLPLAIPQSTTPGAVIQPEQRQNFSDFSRLKKNPKESINTEEPVQAPEEDGSSSTKVFINEIKIEDETLLKQYDVDHTVRPYLNREVTFQELQELTAKLTDLYRESGYVTSRVYLPPQKIENGVLVLQSSEGIIRPITLGEGQFFKARSIFPRLQVDPGDNLNLNKIKNDLARLNENPDMGLIAVLKPGKGPEETELRLEAKDKFPVHFAPFVDNLGRRLIGYERIGFGITHNNLFGFGDRDTLGFNWSKSSWGVSNNYEIPIGKYGTKLGFNYAHNRLRLGKEFEPLNIKSYATVYSPYIAQELYRGPHLIASADLAFDFKNLGTDILGEEFNRDRLRVLRPGLNFDEFDKYGRTFMRHELGIGINALGATGRYDPLTSRRGAGGGDFFRYTGYATRVTQLPFGIQDVFRVIGQYSDSLLNSAEQMQVLGAYTVRGYREGQLIGDSGLVVSNEVRIPAYIFPKSWKFPMTRTGAPLLFSIHGANQPTYDYVLRDNIQLVGFTDFGSVYTNEPIAPVRGRAYAFGTGVGLRVRLTRFLTARADLGFPIIRNLPERQDMVFHFGLQSELF